MIVRKLPNNQTKAASGYLKECKGLLFRVVENPNRIPIEFCWISNVGTEEFCELYLKIIRNQMIPIKIIKIQNIKKLIQQMRGFSRYHITLECPLYGDR